MLELLTDPHAWAALVTLTVLEIVLGIDNIVFISVLVGRCDEKPARRARQIGLSLAFVFRIILLAGLTWIMRLTEPVFELFGYEFSWRDIILIGGGLFLIAKGVHEIHNEVEARYEDATPAASQQAFFWVIMQLIAIDLVFSLDSIITAIGMVRADRDHGCRGRDRDDRDVCRRLDRSPASSGVIRPPRCWRLAFLLLIGIALVADGFEVHIPRGYIYFAMAFAASVEAFNVLAGRNRRRQKAAE